MNSTHFLLCFGVLREIYSQTTQSVGHQEVQACPKVTCTGRLGAATMATANQETTVQLEKTNPRLVILYPNL